MHLNRSLTKVFLALSSIVVGAVAQSSGQWTTSPFNPPAIPLAVKSPYLNSWLPQGKNASAANEAWATFWNEAGFDDLINTGTTELYAGANVDGVSYRLLGNAEVPNVITAQQLAVDITATRTSFLFKAGAMEINATFLSPIDLNNLTTMSRPTTYLYMTASSTDGKSHEVALYSDVSSQWGAVPDLADATVGFANDTGFLHLFTAAAQPARYSEINQQSPSATVYLSMQEIEGMTFEVGLDSNVRANFAVNSSLASAAFTQGGEFIDPSLLNSTSGLPTLGMAVDLGDLKESGIVVWTLTLMETSNIQFASVDGIQHRYPYYLSESLSVPNTSSNIAGPFEDRGTDLFLQTAVQDFDNILLNSISIDNAVRADGLAVSQEYADILALSLRQVVASMEITISVGSDGQWNTSDVMSFMKNMGSLGSSVGINCVDILYSAFPAFLYLNSAFGRYLLEPLFNYQDSPAYTLPYAAQDIGTVYPNATGNPNPHMFGIEESANMIIMTYADILASGDGGLASQHYTLLKSWGSYLLNNSLLPGESLAPEFAEDNLTNMTNLALKGIIGLGAMAQISDFLGFVEDGSDFRVNAEAMIAKWQQMAVIDDQVFLSYNAQNVTGLLYNLYADKMLELGLVPQSVYDAQSVYYGQQTANVSFGVATASSKSTTRADWLMLSAASLQDESNDIRDAMILQVHRYLSSNTSSVVFPLEYDITDGFAVLDVNSPAVGGMFAVLAANRVKINPIPVTTLPTAQSVSSSSSSHVKRWLVIFISTFLSALGLVLVFLAYYFMRRRHAKAAQRRRQTFVRLQDLPRSATPRRTEGVVLSPLPNFDDVDFKAPVDADTESLSEAIARKGFMEQQRAMEHEGADPPSYVDAPDAKTDGEHQ